MHERLAGKEKSIVEMKSSQRHNDRGENMDTIHQFGDICPAPFPVHAHINTTKVDGGAWEGC